MAMDPALAEKIAKAKTGGGGDRLNAGEYVAVIKQILCQKRFKGMFFIPEFEIEASAPVPDAPGVEPGKPGSDGSYAWQLDKTGKGGEAALGNIKQFVCALLNLPEDGSDDEIIKRAGTISGPPNDPDRLKMRGYRIAFKTKRKTIESGQNAGKPGDFPHFTHVSEADGNSAAEVAERRADLDKRKK